MVFVEFEWTETNNHCCSEFNDKTNYLLVS